MKTVTQQILEALRQHQDPAQFRNWVSQNLDTLMEEEKDHIITAFKDGMWGLGYDGPEDYYHTIFLSH